MNRNNNDIFSLRESPNKDVNSWVIMLNKLTHLHEDW